jgi:hypothetical protein
MRGSLHAIIAKAERSRGEAELSERVLLGELRGLGSELRPERRRDCLRTPLKETASEALRAARRAGKGSGDLVPGAGC